MKLNVIKTFLLLISLSALEAPSIVNNLSDQRVNVSDSTMLVCEARGTPTPNITWTKDNQTVVKGSGERSLENFGQGYIRKSLIKFLHHFNQWSNLCCHNHPDYVWWPVVCAIFSRCHSGSIKSPSDHPESKERGQRSVHMHSLQQTGLYLRPVAANSGG